MVFVQTAAAMVCCPSQQTAIQHESGFTVSRFGCGVGWGCNDFTAKLFQLSLRQAAEKLASDFGLSATGTFPLIRYKLVEKPIEPERAILQNPVWLSFSAGRLAHNLRAAESRRSPASLLHRKHTLRRPCAVSAGHSFAGKLA